MNKILFVDDEVELLDSVKRTLHRRYAVDVAVGARKALQLIKPESPYAVIVSDMNMPEMNGVEFFREVKKLTPDTVRMMLTGNADQKTAIDALNEGDIFRFLQKPCDREELVRALTEAIQLYDSRKNEKEQYVRAVIDAETIAEKLSAHNKYDKLTGLLNRQQFELQVKESSFLARVKKEMHTLCFVDIDKFVLINEACGQSGGDECLSQLVKVIEEGIRSEDCLARLGGNEFGIILKGCTLAQAEQQVRRIRESIAAYRFQWESKNYSMTCSIGLLQIADSINDVRSLLHIGENLCLVAKEAGGDRVNIYREDNLEFQQHSSLSQWSTRISHAIDENRFRLFFQRIVPLDENRVEGEVYELLIRMVDEDGRIIPPGLFLPAAEKYHQSAKIDRWVVSTAFDWLCAHPEHLQNLRHCGINLSGLSLGDEEMPGYICQRLNECEGLAGKICFEITETAAIANMSNAMHFINVLRERGCKFALDDFGSGLSSFSYLKTLPVDYLKIDGIFIKEIDKDHIDYAMVKSINEIGKVMGKQTIAEFVEDENIMNTLREIGVDYAQGYHINKPQPIDELLSEFAEQPDSET